MTPDLALSRFFLGTLLALHGVIYAGKFGTVSLASSITISALGLLLLLRPSNAALLIGLGALTIDGVLQAPVYSNHTILKNFLTAAALIALIYAARAPRNQKVAQFWSNWQPVGRTLLIIMYFFGVFHKINDGFLNPESSCATALWEEMPLGLASLTFSWLMTLGAAGTLAIETVLLICLLVPKWRHLGVTWGIGFHAFLGLSGYAFYAPFSTLTIFLHTLFISPSDSRSIAASSLWLKIQRSLAHPAAWFCLPLALLIVFGLVIAGSYSSAGLLWLLAISPAIVAIWSVAPTPAHLPLWSPAALTNAVSALFLLNCITPYLGLKTAQSMNMFANLRLEGGQSNHWIISTPPAPFNYLDDIVKIEAHGGIPSLVSVYNNELWMVRYHLFDQMERHPSTAISFSDTSGNRWHDVDYDDLSMEIDDMLHPRWFRKWFHFIPVSLTTPTPCGPE